jgi:COMPASS component SDC1
MRNTNPNGETERTGSRAASAHPDPSFTMPPEAPAHGAPVRQYINTKVTGVLLEGMKLIAKEQ